MTEDVMEAVGLFEIIEAVRPTDEIADRKASAPPASRKRHRQEPVRAPTRIASRSTAPAVRSTGRGRGCRADRGPELRNAFQKRRDDPRAEVRHLPREQRVPDAMLVCGEMLPFLRHEIVAPVRRPALGGRSASGRRNSAETSRNIPRSFAGNKKPRRSEAWRGGGPVLGAREASASLHRVSIITDRGRQHGRRNKVRGEVRGHQSALMPKRF